MGKALQVTMVFQFNGVENTESEAADKIMQELSMDCDRIRIAYDASAVWVDDAFIREGVEIDDEEEEV